MRVRFLVLDVFTRHDFHDNPNSHAIEIPSKKGKLQLKFQAENQLDSSSWTELQSSGAMISPGTVVW